jgi:hypothetical protein
MTADEIALLVIWPGHFCVVIGAAALIALARYLFEVTR